MILEKNRVRIGYCQKLSGRVGYRVPVRHCVQHTLPTIYCCLTIPHQIVTHPVTVTPGIPSSCNMSRSPRDKASMPMLCYCKMIIYHIDNQISFPRISRSTQFHCRYHVYIMSFAYVSLHVYFKVNAISLQVSWVYYEFCMYHFLVFQGQRRFITGIVGIL